MEELPVLPRAFSCILVLLCNTCIFVLTCGVLYLVHLSLSEGLERERVARLRGSGVERSLGKHPDLFEIRILGV